MEVNNFLFKTTTVLPRVKSGTHTADVTQLLLFLYGMVDRGGLWELPRKVNGDSQDLLRDCMPQRLAFLSTEG